MRRRPQTPGRRTGSPPVLLCLLAGLLLLATSTVAWGREIPAFQGYVNDYAGMISPGAEQELTALLAAFDQSDSTQVAILTIDSLEGEDLEGFSIRVVDQWQVGQKGKDNGVLLLVAKQERKIRIEVGRGLEGVLTDLLSGRIIDQAIAPAFKAGQLDQGFLDGANAIIAATRGEFKADPRSRRSRTGGKAPPIVSYLFVALLLVAFLGNVSKKLGAGAGAVLLPLAAYGGMGAALPLLFLLLLIPAGLLAGIIAPLVLNAMASGHGGGMYYGGFGGRGGGFGGGGGGGFGGFGGGGFGGGGASGGW